jgi:hypothetical protein
MYEMSSQALPAPLRVPTRRRTFLLTLVAALLGAAATAAVLLASGASNSDSEPRAKELRGQGFALAYPGGWAPLPAEQLAKIDGRPVAVVRRADGAGTVVVRRKAAPKDQSLRALTRGLTAGLERRFPDFRFVSARVVPIRGGDAFLYTFTRTSAKTAQSIALVRVGAANYTVDGVARTGDPRAAREVAAIVRSFGP